MNRDAIGAVVHVTLGDRVLRRVKRRGEGFAAQNSATLLIGIGEATEADEVTVVWPSGDDSTVQNVSAGSRVVFDGAGRMPSIRPYRQLIERKRPHIKARTSQ